MPNLRYHWHFPGATEEFNEKSLSTVEVKREIKKNTSPPIYIYKCYCGKTPLSVLLLLLLSSPSSSSSSLLLLLHSQNEIAVFLRLIKVSHSPYDCSGLFCKSARLKAVSRDAERVKVSCGGPAACRLPPAACRLPPACLPACLPVFASEKSLTDNGILVGKHSREPR